MLMGCDLVCRVWCVHGTSRYVHTGVAKYNSEHFVLEETNVVMNNNFQSLKIAKMI